MDGPKKEEEEEERVHLHQVMEAFLSTQDTWPRDLLETLMAQMSHKMPVALVRIWFPLQALIKKWMEFQHVPYPNQEADYIARHSIMNTLQIGQEDYARFLKEEESSMTYYPSILSERLVNLLRDCWSILHGRETEELAQVACFASASTLSNGYHTSTLSTTAAGPMGSADAACLQDSIDAQIDAQFGLQTPQPGTTTVYSHILHGNPENCTQLKWMEPTGSHTLELKLWKTEDIKDVPPDQIWKYCAEHMKVQVPHPKTVVEALMMKDTHHAMLRHVKELVQLGKEKLIGLNKDLVTRTTRKRPSTKSSDSTRYRPY